MPEQQDPSAIFKMLVTQFLEPQYAEMAQAPMPTRMAMPDFSRPVQEPIDMGAGGPPPGSPRTNALSSIGNIMQTLAPLAGSALASRGAQPTTQGAGAWNNSALGNRPNITAPQLGTAQNFNAPAPSFSLNKPLVQPAFSFKG